MNRRTRSVVVAAAAVTGTLAGAGLGLLVDAGTAQRSDAAPAPWIEATHLPPLLTAPGERVELRYDAFCFTESDVDAPCDVDASVRVRRGESGAFEELPVREERGAVEGRFVALVPDEVARAKAGFAYYAVLHDRRTGATATLPAGGEEAPLRSRPLARATVVELGEHRFGAVRGAAARVVRAPWGSGAGAVGLENGRDGVPVGGSSFDVTADGVVHVLDEGNRRVLRWRPGSSSPEAVPVAINGTIADLAVAPHGPFYVLETTAPVGEPTLLRAFDTRGQALAAAPLLERGSQVRLGGSGVAHVLEQPSSLWREVYADGRPGGRERQRATGRPGRPLRDGDELVVLRDGNEVRVAVVDPRGDVADAWRITSGAELAEVQLAEKLGRGVVLVVRVYSETDSEFRVLVLDRRGLVDSFAVDAADWAETAPLSRFRLVGSSLYRLGSTPDGLFVDRFDLEVRG